MSRLAVEEHVSNVSIPPFIILTEDLPLLSLQHLPVMRFLFSFPTAMVHWHVKLRAVPEKLKTVRKRLTS